MHRETMFLYAISLLSAVWSVSLEFIKQNLKKMQLYIYINIQVHAI